jgi:hypothetical protein
MPLPFNQLQHQTKNGLPQGKPFFIPAGKKKLVGRQQPFKNRLIIAPPPPR